MKKNILWLLALLFPFMGLVSCSSDDDIVFDHEQPMFDIQADKILLEVILPTGTSADDEVYISGAFNGGDEVAVGNPDWALLRTEKSNIKRAVYLDPAKFQGGATLADGYHFVSATQRNEVSARGDSIVRREVYNVGTRTNIFVDQWAAFFDSGKEAEIEHDGFVLFVDDQSGWPALGLYAWGDAEAFGGWPGKTAPTGTQLINGVRYKYFDLGEENTGLTLHLILNDVQTNNKQVDDVGGAGVVIDHDIYVRLTESGWEPLDVVPTVKHDGYALFILNESSQTDLALYAWGDGLNDAADLFGGWPGMAPTGTQTINGLEYIYFDLGEGRTGFNVNLIPNNNNGGVQWEGGDLNFTIDHDIYLRIFDGGYEVISKDYQGGGSTPEPEPQPASGKYNIYVQNQTGWDGIALYAWGDGIPELFGGWPGNNAPQTVNVAGTDYVAFSYDNEGEYHLIFNNNNGGTQYDGPVLQTGNDFYLIARADGAEDITRKLYINDQTGWDNVGMYAWGDGLPELFGGWPGKTVYGTETIDGVTYKVFTFPAGTSVYNPIINGSGGQFDLPAITLDKDYFFTVTANGVN